MHCLFSWCSCAALLCVFLHELVYDDILLVGNNSTIHHRHRYLRFFNIYDEYTANRRLPGKLLSSLMVLSLIWDVRNLGRIISSASCAITALASLCCALFIFGPNHCYPLTWHKRSLYAALPFIQYSRGSHFWLHEMTRWPVRACSQ